MVADLGGDANYSSDFDGPAMARVYANAMAFARVKNTLERASSQYRPTRVLELLPALEREYGIVPDPNATVSERRRELAAAARIARGASKVNIDAVLGELLGDDFVSYAPIPYDESVVTSTSPGADGIYRLPGTQRSVFRLLESVITTGAPATVAYEAVVGAKATLEVGDTFAIDAGVTRSEIVEVEATGDDDGTPTITATFTRAHQAGTLFATGRFPYLASTKRHNLVTLTESGSRSRRSRRRAERALKRLLRGVSTWSLIDGGKPFAVEAGAVGLTLLARLDPSTLSGLRLWFDLQDRDSYTVTVSSPDYVGAITNKASGFEWTELTDPPYFDDGVINGPGINGHPCILGDGLARRLASTEANVLSAFAGDDAEFSLYAVIETDDADQVWFGASNFGDDGYLNFAVSNADGGAHMISKASNTIKQEPMGSPPDGAAVIAWISEGGAVDGYIGVNDPELSGGDLDVDAITPARVALFSDASSAPGTFSSAKLGELLLFAGAHDEETRVSIQAYLQAKWR